MRVGPLRGGWALMLVAPMLCAAELPPPPTPLPGVTLVPVLEPAPGETVAQLWRAQTSIDDRGEVIAKQSTAPAEGLTFGGLPVLKLTCNFADTTIPRGVWDRTVQLDLTRCTAVCFDVYAENLRAIGRADLYLRSGDGWYGAYWYPKEEGQWCRIRLPLGEFYVDKPGGGWGVSPRKSPSSPESGACMQVGFAGRWRRQPLLPR